MWEISCNLLKDYLSPDIWREYGPKETEQERGEAAASVSQQDLQEPPMGTEQQKSGHGITSKGGGSNEEEASSLELPEESEQR
mgnify:CR=1 FL=1